MKIFIVEKPANTTKSIDVDETKSINSYITNFDKIIYNGKIIDSNLSFNDLHLRTNDLLVVFINMTTISNIVPIINDTNILFNLSELCIFIPKTLSILNKLKIKQTSYNEYIPLILTELKKNTDIYKIYDIINKSIRKNSFIEPYNSSDMKDNTELNAVDDNDSNDENDENNIDLTELYSMYPHVAHDTVRGIYISCGNNIENAALMLSIINLY